MKSKSFKSNIYLTVTALIWGFAFVAQSVGMDYIGPFTFNAIRCLIGAAVLLPLVMFNQRQNKASGQRQYEIKHLIVSGILCGFVLFVSSSLQQIGLKYTSVGKSGFITALYIVLIPVIGIFFKKRSGLHMWFSILLAVFGMYLLCINEDISINIGDVYTFFAAIGFALHIIFVDYYIGRVDGVSLSCVQLLVCSVFSAVMIPVFGEDVQVQSILAAWLPLIYAGAFSCGIAYTFQILGQKGAGPVSSSLILSFESVFALLGGIIILKESPQIRELIGSFLMFIAVLFSQLYLELKKRYELKFKTDSKLIISDIKNL